MIGKLLQRFGAPGFVRPFEYRDLKTDEVITLRTTPRYTILSVRGKELFFLRESGRFDGTGALSLADETGLNYCRAERIRQSRPTHASA